MRAISKANCSKTQQTGCIPGKTYQTLDLPVKKTLVRIPAQYLSNVPHKGILLLSGLYHSLLRHREMKNTMNKVYTPIFMVFAILLSLFVHKQALCDAMPYAPVPMYRVAQASISLEAAKPAAVQAWRQNTGTRATPQELLPPRNSSLSLPEHTSVIGSEGAHRPVADRSIRSVNFKNAPAVFTEKQHKHSKDPKEFCQHTESLWARHLLSLISLCAARLSSHSVAPDTTWWLPSKGSSPPLSA